MRPRLEDTAERGALTLSGCETRGEAKLPEFVPFIRGGTPVRLTMAGNHRCRAGICLRFSKINTHASCLQPQNFSFETANMTPCGDLSKIPAARRS